MKISYAYYTNVGKVRKNNEDALLVMDEIISEESLDECKEGQQEGQEFLFVVADGMGGHEKGEVASRIVLESMKSNKDKAYENIEEVLNKAKKELDKYAKENPSAFNMGCAVAGIVIRKDKAYENIEEVLNKAKKELDKYAKENPSAFNMGCAVAGIVIRKDKAKVFNVGDCRVYRFINNRLIRLTKDHSMVEKLVSEGVIDEDQVRTHPKRNILTSAIMADLSEHITEIYVNEIDIFDGDTFLICSDGVWDELENEEIKEALFTRQTCELLDKMSKTPQRDNFSFIILRVEV